MLPELLGTSIFFNALRLYNAAMVVAMALASISIFAPFAFLGGLPPGFSIHGIDKADA